jgi:hypothetical protein|tara:strand:+ start:217 stop:732 length:516 start_codon:yes stop_codon:yes gene_type:complete
MQITPFIAGKRAIAVYPSDNTEIPFPALVTSGTNSQIIAGVLEDATVDFNALGVVVGDIVYNTTAGKLASAQVTAIPTGLGGTILGLNTDIFLTTNATYSIYTSNLVSGNEGCALYVGGLDAAAAVNVKVVTIGDDIITLSVQKGSLLPCLVKKVFATGTTASLDLIALWQ